MTDLEFLPPMLGVTASEPFDGDDWWFEVKWDGYRAILSYQERFALFSRRGHDLLSWYPQLATLKERLRPPLVLDGELVAWRDGKASFSDLAERHPKAEYLLVVFDCLLTEAGWHLNEPWTARRQRLETHVASGGGLVLSEGVRAEGRAFFEAARLAGLEGAMAKRITSPYLPGQRSRDWQKFLAWSVDRFRVGAVYPLPSGGWQWGILDEEKHEVARIRAPRAWRPGKGWRQAPWVELAYRERTRDGHLRHPILRTWEGVGPHDL